MPITWVITMDGMPMTNDQFEKLADQFYRYTGYRAPGKDSRQEAAFEN